MYEPTLTIQPAPSEFGQILRASGALLPLASAQEGDVVGVGVLAFRHGARIESHYPSFLEYTGTGRVIEPEMRHVLAKGERMKEGVLDLDPATLAVYALLRETMRLGVERDTCGWTQTTIQEADMRTIWVLKDALLVLDMLPTEADVGDAHGLAFARSGVFYDATAHPLSAPHSAQQARDLAQAQMIQAYANHQRAREELMAEGAL